ncbi:receptor-interacting serine/threonine-protein kinase 3-like [Pelodytes ibericus]
MQSLPSGDLECLELVGVGGFGMVYRGWSGTLGTEIALKMIQSERGDDLKGFIKERDLMHKANYTYVLRLLGVYERREGDHIEYGLVMEYMPNGSLRTLFDNVPKVPWALRFQILHQVVLGMNYLHHVLNPPIIHRDLKPRNVLLNKSLDVQITDFGLAKNAGSTTTSLNQSDIGTVSYMPPESFNSINYKPTKAFDVYSFGILTWSVLSGQEPYAAAGGDMIIMLIPRGSRPDEEQLKEYVSVNMVPEAIELMKKCWSDDAEKRPSFSDCKPVTLSMNKAYAEQIDKAVQDVLGQLKCQSTSRRPSKTEDVPDGVTVTSMSNLTVSETYLTIQLYKDVLDPAEETSPEVSELQLPECRGLHGIMGIIFQQQLESCMLAIKFLRKNFATIVRANPDIGYILDDLFSEEILTQEEVARIKSGTPKQEQIRMTLNDVTNKGRHSSDVFVQLLRKHCSSLMDSLVL